MSSSVDEDQERRKQMNMEDSKAMTIDFLRARLLAERSVSKTARQRADQLSKRVLELEEQLKFVSIMRRKAEKATADVLVILENHGISDVSEGLDSNSDHDDMCEVNSESLRVEPLTTLKDRATEVEVYSSSEIESSPSTGRSLSWKNTKDSQGSLEKKKYIDSFRRRSSSTLNSSSTRRAGKSCRRIRRREMRGIQEFENDSPLQTSFSRDFSNCYVDVAGELRGSDVCDGKTKAVNDPMLESNIENPKMDDHYISGHGRDEDMESALQHHTQLIERFEEEEKAQREWEDMYREKNLGAMTSNLLDSCDPGNHSDVTEERDMVTTEVSDRAGTGGLKNRESRGKVLDTHVKELPASKVSPSQQSAENELLLDQRCVDKITTEYSKSETSFPMGSCQQSMPMSSSLTCPSRISSQVENTTQSLICSNSSSSPEIAVVPKEASINLESVLAALQQAKSSLKQTLSSLPPVARQIEYTPELYKIETGSPALFRLPTDDHFNARMVANHPEIGSSRFSGLPHPISGDSFSTAPQIDARITPSSNVFLTLPFSSSTEIKTGAVHQRSLSQSVLDTTPFIRLNPMNLSSNMLFPSITDAYRYSPDTMHRSPLNDDTSRSFSSSETGPSLVASKSSYGEHNWPCTNR